MSKLSDAEVQGALAKLNGWSLANGEITKTFEMPSFPAAIALVNGVAELAEEQGHHPDMDIRYNRVRFGLVTHDAGGITLQDIELAQGIEQQAQFNPEDRIGSITDDQ